MQEDTAILLDGRIDARDDEAPKVLADVVRPLDADTIAALVRQTGQRETSSGAGKRKQAARQAAERLHLKVPSMGGSEFEQVKGILLENRGEIPVQFYPQDTGKRLLAPRGLWVSQSIDAVEKIRAVLGSENVVLR